MMVNNWLCIGDGALGTIGDSLISKSSRRSRPLTCCGTENDTSLARESVKGLRFREVTQASVLHFLYASI